jgi:hypothetical protein
VPPQEVAEWAGHSVYVLLKVYARCLDGERDASNDRIATKLAGTEDKRQSAGQTAAGALAPGAVFVP